MSKTQPTRRLFAGVGGTSASQAERFHRHLLLASVRSVIISLYLVAATVTAVSAVQLLTSANPLGRCYRFWKQLNRQEQSMTCSSDGTVNKGIDDYSALHRSSSVQDRNANDQALVNAY
jgi:hypothetical protein